MELGFMFDVLFVLFAEKNVALVENDPRLSQSNARQAPAPPVILSSQQPIGELVQSLLIRRKT